METKVCCKCREEFPRTNEYFSLSSRVKKDGLNYSCKVCERKRGKIYHEKNKEKCSIYSKEHYKKNKEKISIYMKEYHEKNKEKCSIYRKKWGKDNKKQINEVSLKWKELNKEKSRYISRSYMQRRKAKIKSLEYSLTNEQWDYIKEQFNSSCCYCGADENNSDGILQQEHFIALSKGGDYTSENIIPACGNCNSSKKNKDFFIWYPNQEFYSEERELFIIEHLISQQEEQQHSA